MLGNLRNLIKRLRERGDKLSSSEHIANADKLLDFYTRVMTKVTDAERCSVFINDPEHDVTWLKAGTGVHEHDIEVAKKDSIAGQVITSGKPVIVSDIDPKSEASKHAMEKTGFETRNILCVPIRSTHRNEITGAFELINKINAQTFSDQDMALATEITEHLSNQVDSIFLSQEILSLSDKLYATIEKTISNLIIAMGILMFITGIAIYIAFIMQS